MKKNNKGFSLVELMVAMAIMAILALITWVGISRVRDTATTTACQSNLRSIIIGWQLYCDDHNGFSIPFAIDGTETNWRHLLYEYIGGKSGAPMDVFTCPGTDGCAENYSTPGSAETGYLGWVNMATGGLNCGYGFNFYWYSDPNDLGTGANQATLDAKFPLMKMKGVPGNTPVFSDATWTNYRRDSGIPSNFEDPGTFTTAIARHKGKGVNMAFPDGSIGFVTMGDLFSVIQLNPSEKVDPAKADQVPGQYR